MANKRITELPAASSLGSNDPFAVAQSGETKQVTYRTLYHEITSSLDADYAYAGMYQPSPTIYPIVGGVVGVYLGSVGATSSLSQNIDIQLSGSIPGLVQDQFVVNVDGVYKFDVQISATLNPGGNTPVTDKIPIEVAYATGSLASNIVEGTNLTFTASIQSSIPADRTFGLTKLIELHAGEAVYLVGKATKACDFKIKSSLMNIHRIGPIL